MNAMQAECTQFVDDPDEPSAMPSTGRASTEDLVAHVMVMGEWHRRTPDLKSTSCGVPYHSQFTPIRREELLNPLCRSCFTDYELSVANVRDIEEGEI